jgi:hypothetical protein
VTSESNPIDIVVQTSMVELFQHYGVTIAPMRQALNTPAAAQSAQAAVGTISFRGDEMDGHLMLCMPMAVVRMTLTARNGKPHAEFDWVRELTAQLMGRIKNRLARVQVKLICGLPAASTNGSRPRIPAGSAESLVYDFHSLNGNLSVTLSGRVRPQRLVYTAGSPLIEEGDVLLF